MKSNWVDFILYKQSFSSLFPPSSLSLSLQDLGSVGYVFSDKTGTLTCNDMRLRLISIRGHSFGSLDFRIEDCKMKANTRGCMKSFDPRLMEVISRGQEGETRSRKRG